MKKKEKKGHNQNQKKLRFTIGTSWTEMKLRVHTLCPQSHNGEPPRNETVPKNLTLEEGEGPSQRGSLSSGRRLHTVLRARQTTSQGGTSSEAGETAPWQELPGWAYAWTDLLKLQPHTRSLKIHLSDSLALCPSSQCGHSE